MILTIEIDISNAAFADEQAAEVARILRAYADRIEATQELAAGLRDVNGNTVGCARVQP